MDECLHLLKARLFRCYKNVKTVVVNYGVEVYLRAFFTTTLDVVFPLT